MVTPESSAPEPLGEPVCAQCGGSGVVTLGDPKWGRVTICACRTRAARAARYAHAERASNLTPELRAVTFTSITPQDAVVAEAKAELETFARDPQGWIVLSGTWGTNKTRLMAACANALLEARQHFPLYVVVPDFLDYVRSAYDVERGVVSESANERIEQAIQADVLMLDDLGAQSATPWADEKLFRIINARYNANAPLVVTTNLRTDTIEPRIRSRLFDVRLTLGRTFAFAGDDQRNAMRGTMQKGGR